MSESNVIEVKCKCGQDIARYLKEKKGHLMKMYIDRILIDRSGIFPKDKHFNIGDEINCPKCNKRIATIKMIHGRISAKMNQGAIEHITT